MIAALAIAAASLLAPSGVTATIQADPVCLNVPARPGTVYDLPVYAPGPVALRVTPAHDSLERTLHQVQPSWVRFIPDPAAPGSFLLDLTVPAGAASGAYWSDIKAVTQPSGTGDARLGTAATTALVFTVAPSAIPPPPCRQLDVAQSTGQFPPWPTPKFATSGWHQVYAPAEASERAAHTAPTAIPTAGTGAPAPAPAYSPVANAGPATGKVPKVPSDWPGYLALAVIALLVLAGLRRWLKS